MENLQEKAGWHYNLIVFQDQRFGGLTKTQAQENLDVKLPDGRSFRELFWPVVKLSGSPNNQQIRKIQEPLKEKGKFRNMEGWLSKQHDRKGGKKTKINSMMILPKPDSKKNQPVFIISHFSAHYDTEVDEGR